MSTKFIIEIATTDYITTKNAIEGGADRIELCTALSEGGLTPSFALIEKCRKDFSVQLFPIIRPRGGDFLYDDDEFEIMLKDAVLCKQLGCDGIVIGFLKKDGSISTKKMAKIVDAVYPLEVTFLRAFDRCLDPFKAIEELIEVGCQRILTSGQKPTVSEGIETIAELVKAADDRIIIMPGSGVRSYNIKQLAQKTGAVEFHSSLRSKKKSNMEYLHPAFKSSEESYTNPNINANDVKALRNALND